jgi:hypothetical protein
MKKHLIFGLLLVSINYNCAEVNAQETAENTKTADSSYTPPTTRFHDELLHEDPLYTSIIRVDQQKDGAFVLSVQMNLKKEAYFVSPHEQKDLTGKFTIVLTEPEKMLIDGTIIESPVAKTDDLHGFVKCVRENTQYKQTLKVLSKENFEVYGYLQFTIEPRCTLEKIPFILSYQDGKLSVKLDGC